MHSHRRMKFEDFIIMKFFLSLNIYIKSNDCKSLSCILVIHFIKQFVTIALRLDNFVIESEVNFIKRNFIKSIKNNNNNNNNNNKIK